MADITAVGAGKQTVIAEVHDAGVALTVAEQLIDVVTFFAFVATPDARLRAFCTVLHPAACILAEATFWFRIISD